MMSKNGIDKYLGGLIVQKFMTFQVHLLPTQVVFLRCGFLEASRIETLSIALSMVVEMVPLKRWDRWHSPSPNWQYIPLIYHL